MKIEGSDVTAIEVVKHLKSLASSLNARQQDKFLSPAAAEEKESLRGHGINIENIINEFFGMFNYVKWVTNCIHLINLFAAEAQSYIESWTSPLKQLEVFSFAALNKVPVWKEIEAAMLTLKEGNLLDANKYATNIHEQFCHIKNYCSGEIIKKWNEKNISIEARWVEIFNHFNDEHIEFEAFAIIIEYILSLPGTTAVVERIFSEMKKYWSEEKVSLQVNTLKDVLMVKNNIK